MAADNPDSCCATQLSQLRLCRRLAASLPCPAPLCWGRKGLCQLERDLVNEICRQTSTLTTELRVSEYLHFTRRLLEGGGGGGRHFGTGPFALHLPGGLETSRSHVLEQPGAGSLSACFL